MAYTRINGDGELMNIVRKWGLRFYALGKALEFMERIEELIACYYSLPSDQILKTLPKIF